MTDHKKKFLAALDAGDKVVCLDLYESLYVAGPHAEDYRRALMKIALYPPESNEWDGADKYGEVREIARVALGLPKEVWW